METQSYSLAPENSPQTEPSATDPREVDTLFFRGTLVNTASMSDIMARIAVARTQRHEIRDIESYNADPTYNPGPETIKVFMESFDRAERAKCRGIRLHDQLAKPPRQRRSEPSSPQPRRQPGAPQPPRQPTSTTPDPAPAPDTPADVQAAAPPAADDVIDPRTDDLVRELVGRLEDIESLKCFEGRTYTHIFDDILRAVGIFDMHPDHPWRRYLPYKVALLESDVLAIAEEQRRLPKSEKPDVRRPYTDADLVKMSTHEMDWRTAIEDALNFVDHIISVGPKPNVTTGIPPPDP